MIQSRVETKLAAMGATLIILRHGEKPSGKNSALELSYAGKLRAQALAQGFLGRSAKKSLFGGRAPDAFFAITPHTVETASPSAESWGLPVTAFWTSAVSRDRNAALDARTAEAAKRVRHALKRGKTIVMVWEHKRIAGAVNPKTTLRKLLLLDRLDAVPEKWPDDDYDTLWIVTCSRDGKPAGFKAMPQHFHLPPKPKKRRS